MTALIAWAALITVSTAIKSMAYEVVHGKPRKRQFGYFYRLVMLLIGALMVGRVLC